MKLEPTGERMVAEHYMLSAEEYLIYLMHVATYEFATQFTAGRHVLDYGCGSGYGSERIARDAASVEAVDVAEDAIAYAKSRHRRDNLAYCAIDPRAPLPYPDNCFDVVLSFQVFEHVRDTGRYLSEIRRVLADGGRLVLATPDRSTRLLPFQRPWNRWHLHEYDRSGLARALEAQFDDVEILGMTARREVIELELRRTTRMKWLSLPFTLPLFPDAWRVFALNAMRRAHRPGDGTAAPREFGFDASDILISADAAPSVNLVAVAR